jgi:opacity protein-like surface antigen
LPSSGLKIGARAPLSGAAVGGADSGQVRLESAVPTPLKLLHAVPVMLWGFAAGTLPALGQTTLTNSAPSTNELSEFRSPEDGWFAPQRTDRGRLRPRVPRRPAVRRVRSRRTKAFALVGLLLGLTLLANAQEAPNTTLTTNASESAWSFDIVPYLWLAGYEGTIGPSSVPPGAPRLQSESTDPFTTHISAAFMLTAQVRYRDVGLLLDGAWLQLKTEGDSSSGFYSGTELKSDIAYGTAALSYRLPPLGKLRTDLFAGARVWHISNELEFKPGTAPGFNTDSSQTWTDPILGAHLRYELSRHWFGTVLGDVGGFGAGSESTWSVFGGVGYQFTNWFSAILGYRYMHVDYDKNDFLMNVNIQGFLLGVGFQF